MTRVLVVDDNSQLRLALTERLSFFDELEVVGAAADGAEAVRMAHDLRPDVVIMDVQMPVMDGVEATRLIRQREPSCHVVAHTALEDGHLVSEMVKAGAKAYLLKGGQTDDLLQAIRSVTNGQSYLTPKAARPLVDDLEVLYRKEQERRRELEAMVEQLRLLTVTDYVTGLPNHRQFHNHLDREIELAACRNATVALVRINLDDFHLVNDRFGYATGDAVLTEVAARVTGSCREEDLKARIGGEEFALVLSGAGTALAREVAERALDAIRQEAFGLAGELTASAGVAAFPEHAAGKADLLLRAERAVRVAKSRGKDSVVVWEPHLQATDLDAVSREGQMRAMFALARAVDTRDPYTGMHSQRLARYAKAIAEGLGIRDDRLAIIRASALLHDVGKIGVRDAVLLKPAALDEAEFAEMREHPVLGERIVVGAVDRQISRAIRHHHERVDGTGYPDGLKGDAIPLPSRILLVADAFDAMTSDRIYRKALPLGKAVDELKKYAGTQFDSDIVRMAVSLIESGVIGVLD